MAIQECITIGDRLIGPEQPAYVIAEIGINHNGDEERARQLIDAAKQAGADAVKFQKRHLESLYPAEVLAHPERFEQTFQYMIPLLQAVELSEARMARLKEYADQAAIDFLCTPFDPVSAEWLLDLDVPAVKIASADLTNLELLDHVGNSGKPVIVSTGMSLWEEIEKTVAHFAALPSPLALLHCRSVYPVWPREVNLRMITKLQKFGCPVGYSGHEIGLVIPLVAATMGASIIEKHITLDRTQSGPDHKVSLEPYEFKRLVRDIRTAEQAIGRPKRILLRGEVLNRELFGKSLAAARDIDPGTILDRTMITTTGPGKGLSPQKRDELIGRVSSRSIPQGTLFLDSDLLDAATPAPPAPTGNWGLIARFTDFTDMLIHRPKVIEFHLAEKDFDLPTNLSGKYACQLVVHGPEYMASTLHDLCSQDEETRRQSVLQTIRTVDLARTIAPHFQGTVKVVTHPGAMSLNTKLPADAMRANLVQSLADLRSHGLDGVEFLLENLPPYPWYFGGQWKGNYFMDSTEIADFCRAENIGICFDLSHAALYCNAKEQDLTAFITTVMDLIRHIHFADGYGLDGEGMQIGEGDIDMKSVLPLFAGYQESWVPEIWRGHLNRGQGFLTALERLQEFGL